MALTKGRNTPYRIADKVSLPVAEGKRIYEGSIVVVNAAGYAEPATKAEDLIAAGRAETYSDNTEGAAGDASVVVKRGCFLFDNSSTAAVTQAHVLKDCYIEDDETVTSASAETSKAGKVLAVDSEGVWVEIR